MFSGSDIEPVHAAATALLTSNTIKGTVPSKYTLVALGVNIGLDYYEIDELLAPIGERLDEFLDKDQIIVLGIHKYKDEEGVNRLAAINEELVSVGCIPLKTN